MNLGACLSLPRWPKNATSYQAIQLALLATALSSADTRTTGTRFNPGTLLAVSQQFEILYFAEDPNTATSSAA